MLFSSPGITVFAMGAACAALVSMRTGPGIVEERVVLQGRQPEVFDFIADFSTTSRWDPGVVKAARDQDGPIKVGDSFSLVTVWKGSESNMKYKLTELERPNRIVLIGEGAIVRARDTIIFKPSVGGGSTEIHYRLELSFKGPLRPFVAFIQEDLIQLGRDAMDGLTQTCENMFGK